jgi:hypothetical protein
MKIIQFYKNEISNEEGYYFDQVMKFNKTELERFHCFIQYLFPLLEPSEKVRTAPIITQEEIDIFKSDHLIRTKLKKAFFKMLDFYRLSYCKNGKSIEIKKEVELLWWVKPYDHNLLRMTRMLKSMKLLGYFDYSLSLFEVLKEYKNHHNEFIKKSYLFWENAINEELETVNVFDNNIADVLVELKYCHSKTFAKNIIQDGGCLINGRKINSNYIIESNDIIRYGKQKHIKLNVL